MAWLLGIALLGTASSAFAQGQILGVIRGTVTDEQGGVLPGVVVSAIPAGNRPAQSTTTDAAGFYTLTDLLPGSYEIRAELSGFTTLAQPSVVARAGLNLSLDLVMTVGGMNEVVTVRRESPLLETKSATTAVNVSGALQRSLPLSRRNDWADFLHVTPGAISSETPGYTYYSVHGSYFGSHVLQIDGADVAAATNNATSYIRLSTEAIQDVQVKTAALDASAPLGLGAVVNLATSSGSNRLAGAADLVFQAKAWNAANTPDGTSTTIALLQPDMSIGGPLRRDRAWFFGSYRRTNQKVGLNRTPAQLSTLQALVPNFRPFDNETAGNTYFAKLTGQLSGRHQLTGFGQYDVTPEDGNLETYADKFALYEQGGEAYTARLSSVWGESLTTRLMASYNNKAFPLSIAHDDRPSRSVYGSTQLVGGRLVGVDMLAILDNYPSAFEEHSDKVTLAGDMTYFRRGWLGDHEVHAGLYLQPRIRISRAYLWPNDGFAIEDVVLINPRDPATGVIPFHQQRYDQARVPFTSSTSSDYAVYVQDAWRPASRLTMNVGLRVDVIRQRDTLFDVLTQRSVEVGPRVGVNYLLTSDARNTLRASWSRVHDGLSATVVSAGSSRSGIHDSYDLDFDGTFETSFTTPGSTALARDRVFDLDAWHQPYVDEWTMGYRRQLRGGVSFDVGWIRRDFRDRATGVEVNRIYEEGRFQGYRNEALNQIYRVANNVWNWPVYSAFEMLVGKDTERLQVIASYTRQWRHLAGTWQPNDPAAYIQPDAFPNEGGIGSTRGFPGSSNDANSLSGFQGAQSALAEWHDHALRLGANLQAPWQFVVGTTYTFQSGIWSGPVVTQLAGPDPRFGPPTIQLSNGRVVSNPLATPVRFAGATRSDGQFTLPAFHAWNLRIGRDWAYGRRQISTSIDVFNVTNHGADQHLLSGGNQLYSESYRVGTSRQLPRSARISVRFVF